MEELLITVYYMRIVVAVSQNKQLANTHKCFCLRYLGRVCTAVTLLWTVLALDYPTFRHKISPCLKIAVLGDCHLMNMDTFSTFPLMSTYS